MTRWARANNIHKHKPADPTPWDQLKHSDQPGAKRKFPTTARGGQGTSDALRRIQRTGGADYKKPNKKKKDYDNEDVNGFMEFLQKNGGEQDGEQGLREEVETALRKDGRREERRIRRQTDKKNKMLCFNCKQPGHGLADCPEAERDVEMGRGICFRCGSTEHEVQRCRAKVDPALGEFPFAKCFICGKTGHLSRSCPDNPRGLYKEGGSCHVCGSVEHFQKDCPEHQDAAKSITLGWLSNNMSADHEDVDVPIKKAKPKQAKVVMF
ncbi:hypothetical protein NHX12_027738 [Muraenolepis orangiensis]|uniref:CCHC-type domain-containing protein n=1 Tax=Muraenolepis orangiensis TaxID=630683 RepID=A0A9Q0IP51_9TELE|nr:hypothetical protein NHX12_027738 [Muraenolepis orangiensis]